MVPAFLQPERVPFVDVTVVPAARPVVDVELPPAAAAPATSDSTGVLMFERLVCDPNVSVEKCERMMALWERGEARRAATLFHAAMTAAQAEMRPIAADMDNPQTKSRYASYAALDRALRPIYTKHGFALSFNTTDAPEPETVRVLCKVTLGGHVELYQADLPADGKGARGGDVMTRTHATGSAMSYGMRYLLKMIFNVAVGEKDDDGNRASAKPRDTRQPAAPTQHPSGYLRWLATLRAAAPQGLAALERVWYDAPKAFRQHLDATNLTLRTELKTIAAQQPVAKAS
jgi:ERF superfamily